MLLPPSLPHSRAPLPSLVSELPSSAPAGSWPRGERGQMLGRAQPPAADAHVSRSVGKRFACEVEGGSTLGEGREGSERLGVGDGAGYHEKRPALERTAQRASDSMLSSPFNYARTDTTNEMQPKRHDVDLLHLAAGPLSTQARWSPLPLPRS